MTSASGGSLAGYLGLLALLYLPLPLFAQAESAAPSAAEEALRKPTDFRSRVELRNEYQDLGGNGYRNLIIPRLEYAVTGSVLLRIEVPYIWYEPGVSGGNGASGVGDLLARAAWRALQTEGFALVLAADVIFDTALDDRLGQGRTILAPHSFAAIDLPKYNSTFFPNIQHYFSIGDGQNRADVSFTTLKPNLLMLDTRVSSESTSCRNG